MAYLTCVHLPLILAISLSPGNSPGLGTCGTFDIIRQRGTALGRTQRACIARGLLSCRRFNECSWSHCCLAVGEKDIMRSVFHGICQ